MTDYISREAAIEFVASLVSTMSVCVSKDECVGMQSMKIRAIGAIRDVPAADVVEVKHGEWTIVTLPPDPGYKAKECSVCRCNFWDLEEWNFCPNCGARMKV